MFVIDERLERVRRRRSRTWLTEVGLMLAVTLTAFAVALAVVLAVSLVFGVGLGAGIGRADRPQPPVDELAARKRAGHGARKGTAAS